MPSVARHCPLLLLPSACGAAAVEEGALLGARPALSSASRPSGVAAAARRLLLRLPPALGGGLAPRRLCQEATSVVLLLRWRLAMISGNASRCGWRRKQAGAGAGAGERGPWAPTQHVRRRVLVLLRAAQSNAGERAPKAHAELPHVRRELLSVAQTTQALRARVGTGQPPPLLLLLLLQLLLLLLHGR